MKALGRFRNRPDAIVVMVTCASPRLESVKPAVRTVPEDCPVAVSVRAYSRRVECERAMSQFLEIVRRQPPVINEIRYVAPGSRPS